MRSWARLAAPALCALAGCGGGSEPPRVATPARHALLIVVDTLRADRVDAFGGDAETTATIDQLARRGVVFTRAVAQSSWTAPSMVSLHTSRYLAERRLAVPQECSTLAERFRAAGFGTAAFVTNPLVDAKNGFDRGFDAFHVGRNVHADGRLEEWIRARAGRPTFTYVHLTAPHDPYTPPPRLVREPAPAYDDAERAWWEQAAAEHGLVDTDGAAARIGLQRARYDGEVRATDLEVAAIVRALEQAGELERTAIALTADHGEGLWSHLDTNAEAQYQRGAIEARTIETFFKQRHGCHLYEELIRVPLIVAAPGMPAGAVVDALVENVDLAPTLLELAGLPPARGTDGSSLVGAVLDDGSWTKREAFSMTRYARSVTTAEGWKLIRPTVFGEYPARVRLELFDLRSDPRERRDRSAEEPARVAALAARIADFEARGLGARDPAAQAEVDRNQAALRALGYFDGGDAVVDPAPAAGAPR